MTKMQTRAPSSLSRRVMLTLTAAATLSLVAACGGGGGDDAATASVGGTAPSANTVAWASGPISGLGSIIVNGVRYDDSSARVQRDEDDSDVSRSSLKIGMMVEVRSSSVDDSTGRANASEIRFGSELVGAVSTVDTAASTFTMLDQVVEVTSTTVFDDSLTGGFAGLKAGTVVEVHALFDAAAGRYVATRIEDKPAGSVYRLRGLVAGLDTTAKTFKIGNAVIAYGDVPAANLPANLANGTRVRVQLKPEKVNDQWVATAVRSGLKRVEDHNDGRVRGTVTAFTSAQAFEVNGLKIDATNAKLEGPAAGLILGARVDVRGTLSNGVLVATKIKVHGDRERSSELRLVELHGAMSALDTTAKTFMLRDVKVDYAGVTEWKDGGEANLANGKQLEVKGSYGDDRMTLKASKVEFE
jgi:hypothetical protein